MSLDFDQLDLLGYQLVLIRAGSKAPLRKGWTEHEEPIDQIEAELQADPRMGVGVKLGGPAGIIDIEGDGPAAVQEWEDLTQGLEVPQTASWASSRGTHRLFTLTNETRAIVGEKVIKSHDLEFRLGEQDRYTLQSIMPPCGDRKWLSPSYMVQNLPVAMAKRIAGIREGNSKPLPEFEGPAGEPEVLTRPGDFYDKDADWGEILSEDGWTKTGSRRDGVSDWLRPGGSADQKLSATVNYHKDGKLYVFTSSMAPLESEASYTPFSYMAFTKFDGDFSAASKWCSEHGYGLPRPPPADPLEGLDEILADTATKDGIPHVDTDLLLADGFIRKFAEFHAKRSHHTDIRAGAIGGMILQAWMMGRKAMLEEGTRSALPCLMLAPSGSGKTELVKSMVRVIEGVGAGDSLASSFKSWQALEDNLAMTPNMLVVQEEAQDMVKAMGNPRDTRLKEMAEHLKDMITSADSSYRCRRALKMDKDVAGPYSIDQPSLTILYTGITEELWECITDKQLKDGYWARFWMVEAPDLAPLNLNPHIDETLLAELVGHTRAWLSLEDRYDEPAAAEAGDTPVLGRLRPYKIARTPEAARLSHEYAVKCDDMRRQEWGNATDMQSSYARSIEIAKRFELIIAGSLGVTHCQVSKDITQHAIDLTRASLRFKAYRVLHREGAGGLRFENRGRMFRWFTNRADRCEVSGTWRQAQCSLRKLKGIDFHNAVMDLADEGVIITDGRRDPTGLRWAQRPNKMCLAKYAKEVFASTKKSPVLQS